MYISKQIYRPSWSKDGTNRVSHAGYVGTKRDCTGVVKLSGSFHPVEVACYIVVAAQRHPTISKVRIIYTPQFGPISPDLGTIVMVCCCTGSSAHQKISCASLLY